jgi:hypothetical protein
VASVTVTAQRSGRAELRAALRSSGALRARPLLHTKQVPEKASLVHHASISLTVCSEGLHPRQAS